MLACLLVQAAWLGFAAAGAAADPVRLDDTTTTTPAADEAAKKYPELVEAQKKFQAQDFEGTLTVLQAASKAHPELGNPRVILASLFYQTQRPAAGRQALEKAVQEAPEDPEPYLFMGELALRDARWTDAGLLFDTAAPLAATLKADAERTKKVQIAVQKGQAAVAEMREQWDTAKKHLQAWLKLDEKAADAHFRLGRALFYSDQNAAYAELKAGAKLNPKIPSPEVTVAKLFQLKASKETAEAEKKKYNDMAEKWMASAVQQAPKDLKVRIEVAQWLWQNGRYAEAKKHVDEALKIDAASADAMFWAGLVARYSKDYSSAADLFQKCYVQSPSNAAAGTQWALSLVEQSDQTKRQKALEIIDSLNKQYPRNSEVAQAVGWVLYRLGRLDDAERFFNVAASGGALNLDTIYMMAKLSADRGDLNKARQLLEGALKGTGPFIHRQDAQAWRDQLVNAPQKVGTTKGP